MCGWRRSLLPILGVLYGADDIKCLFPFSTSVMEGNATYRKTNVPIWELIQDFNHHNDAL